MAPNVSQLPALIRENEKQILSAWISAQRQSVSNRLDLMNEVDLERESREFLATLASAAASGGTADMHGPDWQPVRALLSRVSESRAQRGFSPGETATFVMSLKQPLFSQFAETMKDVNARVDETWTASLLLDQLALFTIEMYQKGREAIILRQQQEMLELSTPVVTLWEGILALPLIGTLDSARTQVVMESLLQRIVDTGSRIAILDITGVPTVDTLVAQHLLKTVAAARLMGADCIISGIRPQIAQTIVHLGVDLNSVTTKATLADAFAVALRRLGLGVHRTAPSASAPASLPAPAPAPAEL
jgi:rsbT co-antagonist protein RsbR